jgi:hypothetical protein
MDLTGASKHGKLFCYGSYGKTVSPSLYAAQQTIFLLEKEKN